MKKIMLVLIALVVVLSLGACGNTQSNVSSELPSEPAAEPFTFRGVTFSSTKDQIKEVEGENIKYESSISLRVGDIKLGGYNPMLLYLFENDNNDQQLTSIYYQINNFQGSKVDKHMSESELAFETVATLYADKYGVPQYTNADVGRPCFNKLDWNTDFMMEGAAYKEPDFAGKVEQFAEWVVPDGDDMVDIVVYQKYYPAHMGRVVAVMYLPSVVDSYVETMNGI